MPEQHVAELETLFHRYTELLKAELGKVETHLVTFLEAKELQSEVLTAHTQQRFVAALNTCPNGVIRMSDDIAGVVETSLNVGVITTEANKIKVLCLIRSLMDSGRHQVEGMLQSLAQLAGQSWTFLVLTLAGNPMLILKSCIFSVICMKAFMATNRISW